MYFHFLLCVGGIGRPSVLVSSLHCRRRQVPIRHVKRSTIVGADTARAKAGRHASICGAGWRRDSDVHRLLHLLEWIGSRNAKYLQADSRAIVECAPLDSLFGPLLKNSERIRRLANWRNPSASPVKVIQASSKCRMRRGFALMANASRSRGLGIRSSWSAPDKSSFLPRLLMTSNPTILPSRQQARTYGERNASHRLPLYAPLTVSLL